MALIKCSECGKEISEKAQTCPFCGNPIAVQKSSPTIIEQTGKKWKVVKLISWLLLIVGLIVFFSNFNNGQNASIGLSIAVLGFIGALIGKIGAWWYHK